MALTSIIAANNRIPGSYIKVNLGVGARASGDGTRNVVLFGNKTTGSATANVEVDVFSEDDAISLFGARSELRLMARAALTAWPNCPLKAIVVAESAGANATGTIVFTGPATSAGTVGVTVLGEEIEVAFASGDTATAIGAAVATAIGQKEYWPVTAAAATGTVTCTAANKGPRGNLIAVRARVITGTGVGVTGPVSGYLTAGATSDDPQAALDAIATVNRRYFAAPYTDATNLGKFKTHTDAEDEPEVEHRKQFVFGSLDTLANTTTVATGLNFARAQCGWLYSSDLPPSMLAAGLAAKRSKEESTDVAHNFDGEVVAGLKPHYLSANRPITTQLISALNNGITPLASANDGTVYIVRSITTKSQDSSAAPDYRVMDTAKVTVTDEIADRVDVAFTDRFKGFKASQNPAEGVLPPPGVVTPLMCEDLAFDVLNQAEAEGLLDIGSVARMADLLVFELSTVTPGRFNGVIPVDVIEHAHQFATTINQVG